jgi:hypothetical protein
MYVLARETISIASCLVLSGWFFSDYFDAVVQNLYLEISFYEVDDFRKHAVSVDPVVGCAANPDGSALQKVVVIDLRNRDIEFSAGPVLDASQDLPFPFQRGVPPEEKLYFQNTHTHFFTVFEPPLRCGNSPTRRRFLRR